MHGILYPTVHNMTFYSNLMNEPEIILAQFHPKTSGHYTFLVILCAVSGICSMCRFYLNSEILLYLSECSVFNQNTLCVILYPTMHKMILYSSLTNETDLILGCRTMDFFYYILYLKFLINVTFIFEISTVRPSLN